MKNDTYRQNESLRKELEVKSEEKLRLLNENSELVNQLSELKS